MASTTSVSASEFQSNFARYADAARSNPVMVTRPGGEALVVLTADTYARLRAAYRRVVTLDDIAADEASELFEALTQAGATPAARALDHLMDDPPVADHVSAKA